MVKKKKQQKSAIPFRQTLFWDVDPKTIHPKKHRVYIIERILDFWNDQEVKWMWETYPHGLIGKIAKTSRVLRQNQRS